MNPLSLSHLCLAGISALCLFIAPTESAGPARIGAFVSSPVQLAGAPLATRPPQATPNADDWIAIGSDIDEHGPVLWQIESQSLRSNTGDGNTLLLTTYAYSQTIGSNFTFASVLSQHKFNCLDAQVSLNERVFYSGRYGTGDIVGSESPGQDAPDMAFAQSTLGAREDAMLQALCRERPTARVLV